MHPELSVCLKSLARMIYFVTDEEDRAIMMIHESLTRGTRNKARVKVFAYPYGLIESKELIAHWKNKSLPTSSTQGLDAFRTIYQEDPGDIRHFYIITDPERWLKDGNAVRILLNLIHQLRSDMRIIKSIIFVSSQLVLPPRLRNYVQVIRDDKLDREERKAVLENLARDMGREVPPGAEDWFSGLTTFGIEMAVAQSVVKTKSDPDARRAKRIDKAHILAYKRQRINSSDLLEHVDVSDATFDKVGGADRFKAWAEETKYAWTKKGKEFGLVPPKGVLACGVWGCGKSLSIKALGNAWGLPLLLLELGKLRQSGVGDTEANVYAVTSLAEAMAPCILWVDEAEKSFAGMASSNFTDAGTTARALGILSTWHQETHAEICLAMTANNLGALPTEFINRIDDRFYFDMPDVGTREEILQIHMRNLMKPGKDGSQIRVLSDAEISSMPLKKLADTAEGMVPREMEQAVRAAMRRSFASEKDSLDAGVLLQELKTKPRLLSTSTAELQAVLDWVQWDPKVQEGVRARFASSRQSEGTLKILKGGKAAAQ